MIIWDMHLKYHNSKSWKYLHSICSWNYHWKHGITIEIVEFMSKTCNYGLLLKEELIYNKNPWRSYNSLTCRNHKLWNSEVYLGLNGWRVTHWWNLTYLEQKPLLDSCNGELKLGAIVFALGEILREKKSNLGRLWVNEEFWADKSPLIPLRKG